MKIIEAKNISKIFGGLKALSGVSVTAHKGEIVAIIGPNGAGKTTLFNCISGFSPLSEGEIFIEEKKDYITNTNIIVTATVSLITGFLFSLLLHAQTLFQAVIIDRYVYLEPFDWISTPTVFLSTLLDLPPLSFFGSFFIATALVLISSIKIQRAGIFSPLTFSHAGITRTFQNIRLFKSFSSYKNVLAGLDHTLSYNFFQALLRTKKMKLEELLSHHEAQKLLAKAHIKDPHARASSLSYGNQRRVEIARALACSPLLLLLDEPAAGMNETEAHELSLLIESFKHDGITVMLIEHHMAFVMRLSDRIYVLNFGRPLAEGTPKEIQENPHVIKSYLGEDDV